MSPAVTARLFIAADVPEAFKTACAELRAGYGAGLRSARWTRPEGTHLTFKFLGETPEDKMAAIREALGGLARAARPFRLTLGGAGCFGSSSRPRVLWVAVEGEIEAAVRLVGQIESAMESLGYAREGRPFRPHLTLARLDPGRGARIPDGLLNAAGQFFSGIAFEVTELILFQSLLDRAGARYIARARFPLRSTEDAAP